MSGKNGSKLKDAAIKYSYQNDTLLRDQVRQKFKQLQWALDERLRRLWAANEALSLGRGGIKLVSEATGLSRQTITLGIGEIRQPRLAEVGVGNGEKRIRQPGGGRKSALVKQPGLLESLEALVDPETRGDSRSPLRWTCKSQERLAQELNQQGFSVSPPTVAQLLVQLGYSLQANRKTQEGTNHPDRNAQFAHIAQRTAQVLQEANPVISIDTKKKELVGNFKNAGREWEPKRSPVPVEVHDFADAKAIPYGVYEIERNCGWVNVGVDHDTAEFAVASIRRWWYQMGRSVYPQATELLIMADSGGSNGYRIRLWKVALQRLADELGLKISVCHFPPGTSKWNKIEHRMFCHITQNWRGRPLISHEVVVNLIAATTTTKGLFIQAGLDTNGYPKGIKISDQKLAQVHLVPELFHGDWNYSIFPGSPNS